MVRTTCWRSRTCFLQATQGRRRSRATGLIDAMQVAIEEFRRTREVFVAHEARAHFKTWTPDRGELNTCFRANFMRSGAARRLGSLRRSWKMRIDLKNKWV